MEVKETYWSRFTADFGERQRYVTGEETFDCVVGCLKEEGELGRMIELGCGTCSYSLELLGNADHITATDISDEMVLAAKIRTSEIGRIDCVKADAMALPFGDESFNSVMAANLLHTLKEPVKVLIESFRVLRPGGRVFIASFTQQGMNIINIIKMSIKFIRAFGAPPKGKREPLTTQAIRKMLADAGFISAKVMLVGNKVKCIYAVGVKP